VAGAAAGAADLAEGFLAMTDIQKQHRPPKRLNTIRMQRGRQKRDAIIKDCP
jgi:hypothetical protein